MINQLERLIGDCESRPLLKESCATRWELAYSWLIVTGKMVRPFLQSPTSSDAKGNMFSLNNQSRRQSNTMPSAFVTLHYGMSVHRQFCSCSFSPVLFSHSAIHPPWHCICLLKMFAVRLIIFSYLPIHLESR